MEKENAIVVLVHLVRVQGFCSCTLCPARFLELFAGLYVILLHFTLKASDFLCNIWDGISNGCNTHLCHLVIEHLVLLNFCQLYGYPCFSDVFSYPKNR